jgi:hypothetical protein
VRVARAVSRGPSARCRLAASRRTITDSCCDRNALVCRVKAQRREVAPQSLSQHVNARQTLAGHSAPGAQEAPPAGQTSRSSHHPPHNGSLVPSQHSESASMCDLRLPRHLRPSQRNGTCVLSLKQAQIAVQLFGSFVTRSRDAYEHVQRVST